MAQENRLHWADYLVTVLTLVVTLGIGIFFALFKGGQKTKEEYLLGSRQMGLFPVSLSLFVTFQSAISLIGTPADTYNTGTMVFYIYVGYSVANLIGYWTVVPLVYPLRLTSLYHYMQLRFHSSAVRLVLTCIGMLQTVVYMAIALLTPALVLQAAAGLPLWVSVAVVGGVGTIYTCIGGIKSVMWTDVFQTLIIIIGLFTVLAKCLMRIGGFSQMAEKAAEGGRLTFDDIDPRHRHSLWSAIIGPCVGWLTPFFNQSFVQRICSLENLKNAKRATLMKVLLDFGYGVVLTLLGVVLYAYVVTIGCDPYAAGYVNNKNQIIPYTVFQVLEDLPGMAGIYMATLFSGALSSFSSGINALAANTVEDLLARPLKGRSDTTATRIAKYTVWLYGAISIGLAYLFRNFSGPVTQVAFTVISTFGVPAVAIFFLAAGFPASNKYGAAAGAVMGCAIGLWLAIGSKLYGDPFPSLPPGPVDSCQGYNSSRLLFGQSLSAEYNGHNVWNTSLNVLPADKTLQSTPFSVYNLSYQWLPPISFITTLIFGLLVSLLTGGTDYDNLNPKCLFPITRKLFKIPEPEDKPKGTSAEVVGKETKPLTEWPSKEMTTNNHCTMENDRLTSPLGQSMENQFYPI